MTHYGQDETGEHIYERRLTGALQDLSGAAAAAQQAVYAGLRALTFLTGELYDIELVEGAAAADIEHELTAACRALRNVTRAVDLRVSGDRVYQDQVIRRLNAIDPERAAGPLQAATERNPAGS